MQKGPPISKLPDQESAPFVSVMIPTFNRNEHLRQTLESVLQQDPGPGKMQIMVVDNCSDVDDPEKLVAEVGKGRVQFHRNEKNLGLSGNFNRCIELATGEWIHILHSDDFVHPGFYSEVEAISRSLPQTEVIAFRCHLVDQLGAIVGETPDLSKEADEGKLRAHFIGHIPLRCPAVVIRRSAYEKLGGWTTRFKYVVDVEMWSRVIFNAQTHFSAKTTAAFREHEGSLSTSQAKVSGDFWECYELADHVSENMRLTRKEKRRFYKWLHRYAHGHCSRVAQSGNLKTLLSMEWHYLKHINHPLDAFEFAFRLERSIRKCLMVKLGKKRLP